jgi:probable phosphoglycerate mutase
LSSTSDVILSAPFPTEILVVRHASVHNPKNIVYGRLPRFRLSRIGEEQAERTARFVAARPVSTIYTSPLLRARQTASILSQYHPSAPVRRARALIEVGTGYQGESNDILKDGFSFYDPVRLPSNETIQDIFDRMMSFLRLLVRRHVGQTVVAVSHGDPIAITRIGLEGKPLTTASLHATVYPTRASVNQISVRPDRPPELAFFNVADSRD